MRMELPGQVAVAPRRQTSARVAAAVAGAAWPPLILTLPFWPPNTWMPGPEMDWRLMILLVGLIATPLCLWRLGRERERHGRPATRLGVVWRFVFYGGLLAAGLQALVALAMAVAGWLEAGDPAQALGFTETTLLIFGVGFLPVAVMVGISYALWAGLCAAFIAYEPQGEAPDRMNRVVRRTI